MFKFDELGQCQVTDTKRLVISKRSDGYISIAQRVPVETETGTMEVFLKNAIVMSPEGFATFRNLMEDVASKL